MKPLMAEEMYNFVDRIVHVESFNALLKQFIRNKAETENSKWAEITRSTHYMLGGQSPNIDRLAAMTETVLLALDIMDDLQDRDNEGKPWMQCPHELALNAVMALLIGVVADLDRLQEGQSERAWPSVGEMSRIILNSINGQYRDLDRSVGTEAEYIAMVEEKSGSLMHLACYMGYAGLDLPDETVETLQETARYLGVIAQLENDLRDVLRFDLKNDLLQKKRTLPILYLLATSDDEFPYMKQFYDGVIERNEFLLLKKECIQYIENCGCVDYTKIIQSLYIDRVEQLLESVQGASEWKDRLKQATYAKLQASPA